MAKNIINNVINLNLSASTLYYICLFLLFNHISMSEDNKLNTNNENTQPESTPPLSSTEIQDIRTCSEKWEETQTFSKIERK